MDLRLLPGASLALVLLAAAATTAPAAPKKAPAPGSKALFERRILPLLRAPQPSSCAECHLSGVDLKDYIRPTEAETYASLLKQGLVDARRPANSKLLRLIRMSKPKSALLTQKARDAEYAAFAAWLDAAAQNRGLRTGPARPIGPKVSNALIRHARQDQVLASFTRNIWSQEGRCSGCHGQGNPGTERFSKQYGARMAWLIPGDPEATLQQLLVQKAVDTEKPERSPLLLKPIGELKHGGGIKFLRDDRTFQLFLSWLQDYARTVRGTYQTAQSLPQASPESLIPTGKFLEIVDGPEEWVGKSLRVDLFSWDAKRKEWSAAPVASADRAFDHGHGSKLPVFRIVPSGGLEEREAREDPQLPAGRCRLKFYLGGLASTNAAGAAPEFQMTYLGAMEFNADWKSGRGSAIRVIPVFAAEP